MTLVVYDWLLVLGDEYDTIYQSKWTLAKGLLLYICLIHQITFLLLSSIKDSHSKPTNANSDRLQSVPSRVNQA